MTPTLANVFRHGRLLSATILIILFITISWQYEAIQTSLKETYRSSPLGGALRQDGQLPEKPVVHEDPVYPSYELRTFWKTFSKELINARPNAARPKAMPVDNPNIGFSTIKPDTNRLDALKMSKDDVNALAESHSQIKKWIHNNSTLLPYRKGTQGLVTIGGEGYMPMLVVSLRMLRRTGSTLPVEVFLPSEASYERRICEEVLPSLDAKCLLLSSLTLKTAAAADIRGYQYKIFALLFSSFEDVVFVDSDCWPVYDPRELFVMEPYTRYGLVTWPDYWASTASHFFYEIADLKMPPVHLRASTESGEILVSKRKHAETLLLATYYNLYGPSHYYRLLSQSAAGEGDKETFLAAAMATNHTFYQVMQVPNTPGYHGSDGSFHGTAMAQLHPFDDFLKHNGTIVTGKNIVPKSRPMFMHSHMPKMNAANMISKLDPTAKRMWGSKKDTIQTYGFDLEAQLWEEVVWTACELEHAFKDWEKKSRLCKNVQTYWENIQKKDGDF